MAEEDIRRLLSDLDKLEEGVKKGLFKRRKPVKTATEPVDEENGLTETEKLTKRKNELKQLIEVLETEFRESTISEKTYNEAVNKSKQELLQIESKLKKLSPLPEPTETVKNSSGGRLLELEKMKIDMQNQVNDLTLKFSKAEISDEDYNTKVEALRKRIQEIEGEIFRLDKGKSVVEAVPMGEVPRQPEKTTSGAAKPRESVIMQSILGITEEEEKPEKKSEPAQKKKESAPKGKKPEPKKEKEKPKKKPKKKRFSIKSKLFGAKEEKKEEKKEDKKQEGETNAS